MRRSVHGALAMCAFAVLAVSVVFDLADLFAPSLVWATMARWNLAAGIAVGVVASGFGVVGHLDLPSRSRASRVGLVHALLSAFVLALFAVSFAIRSFKRPETSTSWAIGTSLIAFGLLLAATWLATELRDVPTARLAL